jgi:sec-independent protein translocase protein TatB
MLGLGWTEIMVIGVVALIVIGPKDLPMVMNRIGKFAGQIRRMGQDFQREINKTTGLDEVRNLRNSITEPLRKTSEEIRKEFNTMTPAGPKPSGVIKPADPEVESVADEIRAAAGMPPVKPKTATEAAAEYGFKPTNKVEVQAKPAPKPRAKAPSRAKAVPASKVEVSDLAPVEVTPVVPAKKAPAKPKVAAPVKAAVKTTSSAVPAAKKRVAKKPAAEAAKAKE